MYAQSLTPAYFNVFVDGELRRTDIVLHAQQATVDFSSRVYNRLTLVMLDRAVPFPIVQSFEFPIQKAQFIFSRSINQDFVPITRGAGATSFSKRYERHAVVGGGTTVDIVTDISARNPPARE